MQSRYLIGIALIGLLLSFAFAAEPAPSPIPATSSALQPPWAPPGITDEQIGVSINRAAKYLLSKFDSKGALLPIDGTTGQTDRDGLDALCVDALLEAGRATSDPQLDPRDPHIRSLIEQLKRCPMRTDPNVPAPVTFARSFRAAALAVYDRPEDHQALNDDVKWLLQAHRDGAYMYDDSWPNEHVQDAQPPPHPSGPTIIFGGAPMAANGPMKITAAQKTTSFQAPNFKTNNTYLNHRPDNFYYPQLPNNFYFGRDLCIPNKGKVIASGNHPTTPTPTGGTPQPPTQTNIAMGYSDPTQQGYIQRRTPTDQPPALWDNSNSQLASYAVYMAAQAGIDIPANYWQAVDGHWVRCQQDDGQWGYSESDPDPRVSMTCAGLASFFVTYDRLGASMPANKLPNPALTPRMQKSMDWLEQSDNSTTLLGPLTRYVSYNLFTLERVGLDSGYKFFGTHDWYRELASRVISVQWPNGAFGRNVDGYDTVVESAFTLLFLSRGRSPVMMEKLKFDGHWSNRPRDLANTTRFASKALERPLNWEVVPLNRDWTDWLDSPLLYIASDQPPNFSDLDISKLRNYINSGGTLFTHADGNSKSFSDYIEKTLAPKLFPQYPMQPVPADDPIYSMQYPMNNRVSGLGVRASGETPSDPKPDTRNPKPDLPPLLGIRNGSRWLLIHSENDLSLAWQNRAEKSSPQNFQLATNLFVYASGKTDPRNRVTSSLVPPPTTAPSASPTSPHIRVVRLTYSGGNCDPEPAAWPRFINWMLANTNRTVDLSTLPAEALSPVSGDVAVLTGNAAVDPTDKQIAAIHAFISTGGWLLVDDCGGHGAFAQSFQSKWLPQLADQQPLTPIPPTDPMIHGNPQQSLDDLTTPQYRLDTLAHVPEASTLHSVTVGKGRIIFTPIDLITGLLGANTAGIFGYAPPTAQSIAKNVLLAHPTQ